jgi:hypothetical protein
MKFEEEEGGGIGIEELEGSILWAGLSRTCVGET